MASSPRRRVASSANVSRPDASFSAAATPRPAATSAVVRLSLPRTAVLLVITAAVVTVSIAAMTATASATPAPSPSPSPSLPGPVDIPVDSPGFGFGIGDWINGQINSWFANLVALAIKPLLDLLAATLLATPDVSGNGRVFDLW